jgi:hypothetical protein
MTCTLSMSFRARPALSAAALALAACVGIASPATAESVCVKYGPCPLDLQPFVCTELSHEPVRRVCFDARRRFMVVRLRDTYYPHCAIDEATVRRFVEAASTAGFYNRMIRSKPDGTRGPFDCRDHPVPTYP